MEIVVSSLYHDFRKESQFYTEVHVLFFRRKLVYTGEKVLLLHLITMEYNRVKDDWMFPLYSLLLQAMK